MKPEDNHRRVPGSDSLQDTSLVDYWIGSAAFLFGDKVLSLQRIIHGSLLVCVCGVLAGCGGDDGFVPARGVVNYKGAPIAKIAVVFTPADGKGQIAEGLTDEEGKFELQTREPGDGAMVGSYNVSFKYVPDEIPDMPGFKGGKKPEPSPIPVKYGDASKSGHTATVDANASNNVFEFNLQ